MSPRFRLLIALSLGLSACQSAPVPNGSSNVPKPSARPDIDLSKGSGAPSLGFVSPLGSLPANSVILVGANLGSATAVTFNGTSVTFSASGDNQLTVTLPSASNEGVFVVTTPNGSATYNTVPPTITALSATSGAIGSTLTITGTRFTGTTSVSFNGAEASFTVDSATQITATVPGGATDGKISVTNGTSVASNESFDVSNKVVFVKADSTAETKNGASWSTAYSDLQLALSHVAAGDEIWVAKGTYRPGNDRNASFNLAANVKVYGGFTGTEKDLSARTDWQVNATILSGDLDGNDNYSDDSTDDLANNSYHVVKGASNATLDGFTIQGGNANGTDTEQSGAGLYAVNAPLSLSNLIVSNNYAVQYGGGLYASSSSLKLDKVIFANNQAYVRTVSGSSGNGGGIYTTSDSDLVLNKAVFYRNQSGNRGGGLDALASFTATNTVFANNYATDGGGYYTYLTAKVSNVTFANNTSIITTAGAFTNHGSGSSNQVNCLFWNNTYILARVTRSGFANADSDPFVDSSDPDGADNLWLTADDGLQLKADASTVINQGVTGDSVPATDILGNGRVGNPDPGAYEKQ